MAEGRSGPATDQLCGTVKTRAGPRHTTFAAALRRSAKLISRKHRYGYRPSVDRSGVDRSGVDRSGVDRSGVDRSGVDRSGFDRSG